MILFWHFVRWWWYRANWNRIKNSSWYEMKSISLYWKWNDRDRSKSSCRTIWLELNWNIMGVFRLFRQLLHWGPLVALSIIFFISATTTNCLMMYWPLYTDRGTINFLVFLMWNFLTLYNYFLAAFKGPGFVPFNWKPVSSSKRDFQTRVSYIGCVTIS